MQGAGVAAGGSVEEGARGKLGKGTGRLENQDLKEGSGRKRRRCRSGTRWCKLCVERELYIEGIKVG